MLLPSDAAQRSFLLTRPHFDSSLRVLARLRSMIALFVSRRPSQANSNLSQAPAQLLNLEFAFAGLASDLKEFLHVAAAALGTD